jgi:hypothetical protein
MLVLKSHLKINPVYLRGYVKEIAIKGKTNLSFEILCAYIKKNRINDGSDLLGFIDIAAERKEGDLVLQLMQYSKDYFLTTDETYWVSAMQRSIIKSLTRAGLIEHASEAMKFVAESGTISDFVWQPYIEECFTCNKHEVVYSTLISLDRTNLALTTRVWNMLLRYIGKTSDIEETWITVVLDYIVLMPELKVDEAVLTSVLAKLISMSRSSGLVHYLKLTKASVTSFVVSSLLTSLIDKNLVRDALEIVTLIVTNYFGPNVSLSNLSLNAAAWQWVVKEQQHLITKLAKKSIVNFQGQTEQEAKVHAVTESVLFNVEVSDDEDFVFIE